MFTPNDRYGDMLLEDVVELEELEPDDGKEVDFENMFYRSEVRSFEKDFQHQLDQEWEEDYE